MSTEKCGCGHMMYAHDAVRCLVMGCDCEARHGYHKPNTDSGRLGKLPCEAVWWTDEVDYRLIGEDAPPEWPEYLRTEYQSRVGRTGRARLWLHPDFITGRVEIPTTPLGRWCEGGLRNLGGAGGIILLRAHTKFLNDYPGVVRNLRLVAVYDPPLMGNQARYTMV